MPKTANENCLINMICPGCGGLEPFEIMCNALVVMYDDGSDVVNQIDWEDSAVCICGQCGHEATVADFHV